MFGYVRVRQDTLPPEAYEKYEAVYCGLCHTLGRKYGLFSRLFLNYDFAFLAMLLAPSEEPCICNCTRCVLHPLHGKPACTGDDWLDQAAGESVILAFWKLQDTLSDDKLFSRWKARFLCLLIGHGYRKARKAHPEFDRVVEERLRNLRDMEEENSPFLDKAADQFARILCAAVPTTADRGQDRALEQLLYHLGRWIYLIDGVDDLPEDRKAGRYNPILARFPNWSGEEQTYLRSLLDHSLELIGAAFQLLRKNHWTEVVENVIYSGLPGVEAMVFEGRWREHQKNHRRNDL